MNIDKLKKACDRRFFIFVTVVFLVSFIGGLVWFWGETWAQGEQGRLSRLVAEKFQDEDQIAMEDEDETSKLTQEEKTSDILSSPAVLGEMTETVTEETTFQTQASLDGDNVNLTNLANEVLFKLKDYLLKSDASGLYSLAGEDLKTTFGKEEFTEALTKGGKVTEARILSGPYISNEWTEAILELRYSDGTPQKYTAFFHLEEGIWKLFGTEEIE